MLTSHKWRELVLSGRLVCRCHDVFFWCYACFVLLRCPFYDFVQAEVIRSIVLRYASASIATRVSFFLVFLPFLFIWRCRFFRVFYKILVLYHFRFLFVWRVRRTFFPSEWCFSTLWLMAGFFYISFYENSINSIKKKVLSQAPIVAHLRLP